MALLHEAGLSAEEALAAATTAASAVLARERLGRIEPGAPADLVLLRSDPVRAVEEGVALDVVAVVADGRLHSIAELNAALSEHEHFFADSAYATAAEALARALFPRAEPK